MDHSQGISLEIPGAVSSSDLRDNKYSKEINDRCVLHNVSPGNVFSIECLLNS